MHNRTPFVLVIIKKSTLFIPFPPPPPPPTNVCHTFAIPLTTPHHPTPHLHRLPFPPYLPHCPSPHPSPTPPPMPSYCPWSRRKLLNPPNRTPLLHLLPATDVLQAKKKNKHPKKSNPRLTFSIGYLFLLFRAHKKVSPFPPRPSLSLQLQPSNPPLLSYALASVEERYLKGYSHPIPHFTFFARFELCNQTPPHPFILLTPPTETNTRNSNTRRVLTPFAKVVLGCRQAPNQN